jgi:probable O-glycosylation ligase (exosortase A-associated)
MKQTAFMIVLSLIGSFGALVSPFYSVAMYYLFAVLRPQYIWRWAMPQGIPWSQFVAIPAMICALFVLMGGNSEGDVEGRVSRRFTRSHVAFFLFAVWVSLSYFTARNQSAAYPWLIEYLKIFTMFFVASVLVTRLEQVWALMLLAAGALGYIAYEVNFMYLTVGYMGIYQNGYGGLDNNGAGLMLAMGVPLCIYVYLGTKRWWRWGFAAFVPLLVHAVMMTYSRGAMLALILATPLVFFRARNRGQLALAAAALAIALPVLAGAEIRHEFFSIEAYERDGSAQSRFGSWRAGARMAADYPILGLGIRNSNLFSRQYGADAFGRTIHNQFIQIMADSGFPALLFYLMTFIFVAIALRRVRRWARHDPSDRANLAYSIACGVEASLAVFCIGGTFLSLEVFELPYLMLLLGAQLPLVLDRPEPVASTATPAAVVPQYAPGGHAPHAARVGV